MPVVQLEHGIQDFDAWKKNFDFDPLHRQESGVRSYRILRPLDDPKYVIVELDFEGAPEAEKFRAALEELWRSPMAQAQLVGAPTARIVEAVETKRY